MAGEEANRRRLEALKRRRSEKEAAATVISAALRNGKDQSKLTFHSSDEEETEPKPRKRRLQPKPAKPRLFQEEGSGMEEEEEEDLEAAFDKPHLEDGDLMALQTSYGGDARFNLDQRFAESEKATKKKQKRREANEEEAVEDLSEERRGQLAVLERVLGKAARSEEAAPKVPPGTRLPQPRGFRRYDPERPEDFALLRDDEAAKDNHDEDEEEPDEPMSLEADDGESSKAPPQPVRVKASVAMDGDFARRLRRRQRGEEKPTTFSLLASLGRPAHSSEADKASSLATGEERPGTSATQAQANFLRPDFQPFSEDTSEAANTKGKKTKKAKKKEAAKGSAFFYSAGDERLSSVSFWRGQRSEESIARSFAKSRQPLISLYKYQRKLAVARISAVRKAHKVKRKPPPSQ